MGSIYGTLPPRFEIYRNTKLTTPIEYVAIKAAIIQMTKYFAQYFKKDNIRVNREKIKEKQDKKSKPIENL